MGVDVLITIRLKRRAGAQSVSVVKLVKFAQDDKQTEVLATPNASKYNLTHC